MSARGLETKQINAVLKSIAVYDAEAEPIKAKKGGGYEADADLRDQENIPLPDGYLAMSPAEQVKAVRAAAEKHLVDEIHPYVPDAWIDHDKTQIGYEIPFTRQFYVYTPPRPVAEIRAEIDELEAQIQQWMKRSRRVNAIRPMTRLDRVATVECSRSAGSTDSRGVSGRRLRFLATRQHQDRGDRLDDVNYITEFRMTSQPTRAPAGRCSAGQGGGTLGIAHVVRVFVALAQ